MNWKRRKEKLDMNEEWQEGGLNGIEGRKGKKEKRKKGRKKAR